jgi:KDO2-lipid IV(A) lauroyltransferase
VKAAGASASSRAAARAEPPRPTWTDRLELILFDAARGLFAALPRRMAFRLGTRLGDLFYALDRRDRRTALRSLAIAFPEKTEAERLAILRASCRNLGRVAAEVCHLAELTPESVGHYVRIEDPEAWRRAIDLAAKRGGLVLTGHFGNWELLAYAHGLLGHPVTLVHRPMRNRLVDGRITELRARAGTRSIPKKLAAKTAMRALLRRELVAIPADQNQTRRDGVFVRFFGVMASSTPGLARLSVLTGAAVVPVFLVRERDSEHHRLVVLPPVEMVDTGDKQSDIATNTQRCQAVLERMIRQYPEQWIWFHKRWRTQPLGAPKLYP